MLNGHDFLIISCDSCHIKALWHLVNNDGMVTHDWDIIADILENWRWSVSKVILLCLPCMTFLSQAKFTTKSFRNSLMPQANSHHRFLPAKSLIKAPFYPHQLANLDPVKRQARQLFPPLHRGSHHRYARPFTSVNVPRYCAKL